MNRLSEKKANRESLRARQKKLVRMFSLGAITLGLLVAAGVMFVQQEKTARGQDAQIARMEEQIRLEQSKEQHYRNEEQYNATEEQQKLYAKEHLGYVEENEKVFRDVSAK